MIAKRLSYIFIGFLITYLIVILVFTQDIINGKKEYGGSNDKYIGDISVSYNEGSNKFVADKYNSDVQKYITCYEYPIDEKDFTQEMNDKLKEIYVLFSNPNFNLSFAYEDMYTGLHISYNEDHQYFTASTIKAPTEIYLYEEADKGNIDLESYITYTSRYYLEGSGTIQFQPLGTQYKLRDLVKMALVESDNVAYQMSAYSLNYEDVKNFWKEKGAKNFWSYGIWGNISAYDGVIYMKELYNYSLTETDLSKELMDLFYNSVFRVIEADSDSTKIVHKSGWHFEIIHDMALVFDEYPYTLAIMTNRAHADYADFFKKASKLINEFHHLYWKNKADICYKQSF